MTWKTQKLPLVYKLSFGLDANGLVHLIYKNRIAFTLPIAQALKGVIVIYLVTNVNTIAFSNQQHFNHGSSGVKSQVLAVHKQNV